MKKTTYQWKKQPSYAEHEMKKNAKIERERKKFWQERNEQTERKNVLRNLKFCSLLWDME